MNRPLVHLALFTVSLIYGIFFSWARDIMPHYLKPEGFIVLRIGTAAILFQLTRRLLIREKFDFKAHGKLLVICAVTGVAANMLMFFKGMSITTPINGAVLMMVTPVFVVFLDHFRQRKMPGLRKTAGLLLACSGAVLLMGGAGLRFTGETVVGDVWVMLNAASYAFYLVWVKKLLAHYHPLTVNQWTFTLGALLVLPFGAGQLMDTSWSAIPAGIYLKIGYVLVFTTFVVYQLNAWAVHRASPSLVGTYIYLQPVMATFIATLTGRDSLTMQKILFTCIIFAGVYLVVFARKQPEKHSITVRDESRG